MSTQPNASIICQPEGFYLSTNVWNDARYAFDTNKNYWHYIGALDWYVTEENKTLFQGLKEIVDFTTLHDGEYIELRIDR